MMEFDKESSEAVEVTIPPVQEFQPSLDSMGESETRADETDKPDETSANAQQEVNTAITDATISAGGVLDYAGNMMDEGSGEGISSSELGDAACTDTEPGTSSSVLDNTTSINLEAEEASAGISSHVGETGAEKQTSAMDEDVSDLLDEETESVLKTIQIFEFSGDDLVQKDHIEFHGLGVGGSDEEDGSGVESDATDDFDENNPFRCKLCKKTFSYKSNMVRHEKTHSNDKVYICAQCGKAFAMQSYLQQHMRVHRANKDKPFICFQCGKCYSDRWMLRKHEQMHEDNPDKIPEAYKCSFCERTFDHIRNVRRHEKAHHGQTNIRNYECQICHKSFSSMSNYKRHQTTHTDEKPYTCMHCNKSFALLHYLKQHFKTHVSNRDKPKHMCTFCGKVFSENWYLRKHETTHTDDPEFKCQFCGKVFSCISNFKRHSRVHSGEKPFVCQYCGRAFSESGTLRRHERTHTGNKPFICNFCGRSFTVSHAMRRHERTHFEDKPFRCQVCDRTYTDNSALLRHERTHADDKRETLVATATLQDPNDMIPVTQVVRIVQMSSNQDVEDINAAAAAAAAQEASVQVPISNTTEYQVIEQVYQASSNGIAPITVQTVYDSAGLANYLNSQ